MRKLFAGMALTMLVGGAGYGVAQSVRSISAADKATGAKAHPGLLQEFGGAYTGRQAAYATQVGRKVAIRSGLGNAESEFTVTLLDSSVNNAFAIPGGYVYVTRQLMTLANDEAELASVLGHEVGHVAARHSASRNRTATIGGVLAGVVGAVAGNGAAGQLASTVARGGAQLYTLRYGREQEYAADALGVRYITAAGYDPYAAAAMLTQLDAETTLTARIAGRDAKGTPSWASTHPNGADRIARARKLAQDTGRPPATGAQDTAFLRMLDGLPYDDDPAQGVVDGQTFRHPELRVRFSAPTGYTIANGTDAVTIAGSGGQAMFQGSQASSPDAAITARFRALGADVGEGESQTGTANGLSYTYRTIRAAANNRAVDATVVAYRFPAAIYTFTLVTPAGAGIGPFQPLLASVAALTPTQAAAIKGKVVRIVAIKAGDTIESLSARMAYPDYRRERFLTLNGLSANDRLQPGRLVKLVVTG